MTATLARSSASPLDLAPAGFHHESLFHHGDEGFVRATLPRLQSALGTGRPVLVAVRKPRIGLLRDALGREADRVRFADMVELGANPARIIPAWREFLDEHPGRRVLGIGEPIWPGRSAEELRECHLHESLLNTAFGAGTGWELLCPYDLDALDAETLAGAHCSHPHISVEGAASASERYDPALASLELALSPPASGALACAFAIGDLGTVRDLVARACAGFGLGGTRAEDLVLAVNELATNSVTHGGGEGTMRLWSDSYGVVCEIEDRGRLTDPLVGRIRPGQRQLTGRGLWIVNQLCDFVQLRTGADGTVVRVRMRAGGAAA